PYAASPAASSRHSNGAPTSATLRRRRRVPTCSADRRLSLEPAQHQSVPRHRADDAVIRRQEDALEVAYRSVGQRSEVSVDDQVPHEGLHGADSVSVVALTDGDDEVRPVELTERGADLRGPKTLLEGLHR